MKSVQCCVLGLAVLLLAGCGAAVKQSAPPGSGGTVATPAAWTGGQSAEQVQADWLLAFNDPLMLELIAEGQANNRDLQVAVGNMDKAWLLARQAGVGLKPTADLSLGGGESGGFEGGGSDSDFNVALQVSWELDLWGRISAGVSEAEARAQAAEADYQFALHSLSANIARTYFKAIEAGLQVVIARRNLAILQKTMRITQVKYDSGLTSAQDVALNRADVASAEEQLIQLEGSQRDVARALEVLLGRYPQAAIDTAMELPELPAGPPAGLPSAALERRPDLIAAERQIAAAFDATHQARVARLPKISLTGGVNGASGALSDLLNPANLIWQLGANLVAPLMDGGKRKIDIEIATVEQKQAISNYAQKALAAFSEVENGLDLGQVLAERAVALTEA